LSATLSATLSENFSFDENEIENIVISEENVNEKPPQKKRGRKPKGGKIIQQIIPATIVKDEKPNVILHLKCSMRDLQAQNGFGASLEPFHFSNNKNELNYDMLDSGNDVTADQTPTYNANPQQIFNETKTTIRTTIIEEANIYESDNEKEIENKQVWKKLKQLEHSLHVNNIGDKKSACFWCTYDFDNPPVYIPKHFIKFFSTPLNNNQQEYLAAIMVFAPHLRLQKGPTWVTVVILTEVGTSAISSAMRYSATSGKRKIEKRHFFALFRADSALALADREKNSGITTLLPLCAIEKRERGREWEERMKSVNEI
jgi:hypothetical protein